jgi:uncharacterized membrane protein
MNDLEDRFADRLELLGVATGVFLVAVALGTVAGTPWATSGSTAVSIVQLLGVLGMVAIGVSLAWLVRQE